MQPREAVILLMLASWPLGVGVQRVCAVEPSTPADKTNHAIKIEVKPTGARKVLLTRHADGTYHYEVHWEDGRQSLFQPDGYARRLHDDYANRALLYRLLNITSPVGIGWVVLGLLGQVLFTGRMIVQWLASEKSKRSVIPVAFWWMSLVGATMLMIYFFWRMDIVGILGQATGWLIYVRNLVLIYRNRPVPVSE